MEANPQFHGKKVFAYIGTHGMAHGLSFILNSLPSCKRVCLKLIFYLLVKVLKKKIFKASRRFELTNVTFMPFVPKHEVVGTCH